MRSLLYFVPLALHATGITVGPNVLVSGAYPNSEHKEVVIAADLRHPGRMMAAAMLDAGANRSVHTAAYVSFDGGKSWTSPVIAKEHFADDPTLAYGCDGTAYFIVKTDYERPKDRNASDHDFIAVRRSRDGGKTFEPMMQGPQANDRPFAAVDCTGGRYNNRLYIAHEQHIHSETGVHNNDNFRHAVRLLASLDGGATFAGQAYRALMDQGGRTVANSIACATRVLSDGTVVILQNHMTSTEAQKTGKAMEAAAWLQLLKSTDGGFSLEPAVKITDYKSGYNKPSTRGVPADLAVDPGSTKFKDRLYAVWPDYRSGHGAITVSVSADKGKTWTPPKAISEQNDCDNFMAAIAVNKDGVVGVTWYDRREFPDSRGYRVRFTASLDGGETWLPSVPVSEQPSLPSKGSISPGDTAGLTADSDGVFHSAWIDNRTGHQQVWTAPITVR